MTSPILYYFPGMSHAIKRGAGCKNTATNEIGHAVGIRDREFIIVSHSGKLWNWATTITVPEPALPELSLDECDTLMIGEF